MEEYAPPIHRKSDLGPNQVGLKVYNNNSADRLQRVIDVLLNNFNGSQSNLIKSEFGGWHAFLKLEVDDQ